MNVYVVKVRDCRYDEVSVIKCYDNEVKAKNKIAEIVNDCKNGNDNYGMYIDEDVLRDILEECPDIEPNDPWWKELVWYEIYDVE